MRYALAVAMAMVAIFALATAAGAQPVEAQRELSQIVRIEPGHVACVDKQLAVELAEMSRKADTSEEARSNWYATVRRELLQGDCLIVGDGRRARVLELASDKVVAQVALLPRRKSEPETLWIYAGAFRHGR